MNPFMSIFHVAVQPVMIKNLSNLRCGLMGQSNGRCEQYLYTRCSSSAAAAAAGRFALIKASRRFLYSSRGPLDVKTLKAGSRGQTDGAKV